MSNYLVTGGAGFIGSNLVQQLVEQGETVRVLDNFLTGRKENIQPWLDRIELVEGDLRERAVCVRAAQSMDYVIHLAALPSVQRSVEQPFASSEINIQGTIQLLHACAQAGVKRLVYAASSSAYGDQETASKSEDLLPAPLSPYAAAKLAGEHFCAAFHATYALETVSLRYFNVFGPRQDPDSPYSAVIPLFITAMLDGRRPTIFGDGHQARDFTYVQNAVNAALGAATATADVAGKVFNVACGVAHSLLELIEQLNELLGVSIEPEFEPPRSGDVRHSLADISRAREFLDYRVEVDFTEGLRRTIEWHKDRR